MHECQRTPPHVRNDPFRDALVISSKIELGNTKIRIDQPIGMRQRNAGHNRPRRDGAGQDSTSDKGVSAGPEMTLPSGLKREPWHGQSQVRSVSFHATRQPICVQVAEHTVSVPFGLRYAATFVPSWSTIFLFPLLTFANVLS